MAVFQRRTASGRPARNVRNPVILIVEDEDMIRAVAVAIFRSADFEVLEAGSGMAALMILQHRVDVDAAFLDVVMPSVPDGFTLARFIEATTPACAILLTSGTACPMASTLSARTRFIGKPYDARQVVALVNDMIRSATLLSN